MESAEKLKPEVAPEAPSTDRRVRFVSSERPPSTRANDLPVGSPPIEASPAREVFLLAWPMAAAMFGETAIGLVDTFLVSGLGAGALGGVGYASTLMFLGYSLVYGLMRGVKVRVSHATGEGTPEKHPRYLVAGLILSTAVGVVVWAISRDVTWFLVWTKTDPLVLPFARDSLRAVTWGAPFSCALAAMTHYRQGLGDSQSPMVVGLLGNLFHGILGWALIYGHLGLPALGVPGAGYATAVTEALEVAALGALVLRDELRRPGARSDLSLLAAIREVSEIGVPTGVQFVCEMLAFTTFTAILGSIGAVEIAAHQIAINVLRVSFLPGIALSEAASVLIGRALGARDVPRADRVNRATLGLAVGFMAVCGLGFAVLARPVARAFTDDLAVAAVTVHLLWLASVFQVMDAVNIVLRGSLRAAKDVRVVAFVGIVVAWTCIPAAGWYFGKALGLGALGGWLGFIAETTLAGSILWVRWHRGAWRRAYAPLDADRAGGS